RCHLADGPCPHHDDYIAILRHTQNRFRHFGRRFHKQRLHLICHTHCSNQGTAISSDYRWLASGINFSENQCIDRRQHFDEILETIACSGIAMWLKCHNQTTARESATCSSYHCLHLYWVMAVVIN